MDAVVVLVLLSALIILLACVSPARGAAPEKLFPTDLPGKEWVVFRAKGLSRPVCGVVYRLNDSVPSGLPLGGIDTGCIDLETSGLIGYCTIFNTHVPRRGPVNLPILGLSVGGNTWVMTTGKTKQYDVLRVWDTPRPAPTPDLQLAGVETVKNIHYWGHYPVADLEFEADAPVSIGLRVWSPFLPGNLVDSMIPGAVFEVHLRNTSDSARKGTIAFSFPGPTEQEAGANQFARQEVRGDFSGVAVTADLVSYALGVVGKENLRLGGELGAEGAAWANIGAQLPVVKTTQPGSSAAVDFSLAPGKSKVVRFVLTWYAPTWKGGGSNWSDRGNTYTHMYAKHYPSALQTAQLLAKAHRSLLRRVLSWQQVIYAERKLPGWLQDVLVNNYHLITEVGMWAQAKSPIGEWCKPEEGLWGLNECPRGCPQIECGGNSYYGGMAVLYAFPELALSTLRGYKAYMYPDGCPAWIFGGVTGGTPPCEFTMPTRGYQIGQNGSWLVGMVARYWRRTDDDEFLREFYPYLKRTTNFTFNLNPARPYGLISLPAFDQQESFESTPFKGMSSHVGSIRLYHLKMIALMAQRMSDTEFANQCQEWFDQSMRLMEEHLWAGSYYVQHKDQDTGQVATQVMAYQLDGEFMARFDGVQEGVFPTERVRTILAKLREVAMEPWGPRVWSNPDGSAVKPEQFDTGYWTPHGVHAPSGLMLAMTYMYHGEKELGLDLARRIMHNMVCRNGWAWDMPILYRGDTGEGIWGNDYGQMMMPWALPAAVDGKDLSALVKPGGLLDRMIRAARGRDMSST